MPELIDKQKVQTEIASIAKYLAKSDAQKAIIGRILFMIDHMPTIESEPVRHGRWVVKGQDIYCSECNEESLYNPFGASKFSRFCPNCGARMDGGNDNVV